MKKILVIEDNQEVRENLCEILELAHYETHEAENGLEGVKKAREVAPDLILCDVMMPELDGYGVLRILNRDIKMMHIPFMFLTAKAEMSDFRKGMGLGADDYITKPFDEVELMDAIEMRVKKSERLSMITNSYQGIRKFFSDANAERAFQELSKERELRSYDKRAVIYEVGKYPHCLFYIKSGQVKLERQSDIGKSLITNIYGPGDFLGIFSLLQDTNYEDTAICIEACEIMIIPSIDFKMMLFNDRDFSAKFIQLLANNESVNKEMLVHLAFSSVRKKVSKVLIDLAVKYENNTLSITREDLASMAGTARETVIRTLKDFKSEDLIETVSGDIVILDIEKLKNLPH